MHCLTQCTTCDNFAMQWPKQDSVATPQGKFICYDKLFKMLPFFKWVSPNNNPDIIVRKLVFQDSIQNHASILILCSPMFWNIVIVATLTWEYACTAAVAGSSVGSFQAETFRLSKVGLLKPIFNPGLSRASGQSPKEWPSVPGLSLKVNQYCYVKWSVFWVQGHFYVQSEEKTLQLKHSFVSTAVPWAVTVKQ